MNTEKKTFTPAEAEVIRFEKNDVIATSQCEIYGGGAGMIDDGDEN